MIAWSFAGRRDVALHTCTIPGDNVVKMMKKKLAHCLHTPWRQAVALILSRTIPSAWQRRFLRRTFDKFVAQNQPSVRGRTDDLAKHVAGNDQHFTWVKPTLNLTTITLITGRRASRRFSPSRSIAYVGPVLPRFGRFFRQWSAFPPKPCIRTIGGPSIPWPI